MNETAVQVLAPQVKATQDANGNVNLNVEMNVHEQRCVQMQVSDLM